MKFAKLLAVVLLISAFCTMHSGIKKFTIETCNNLSQEELASLNQLLILVREAFLLENEMAKNPKLTQAEKNELQQQAYNIGFIAGRKSTRCNEKIHRNFNKFFVFIQEHNLQLCDAFLAEIKRRQNK